jgi:hypothetical protein
MFFLKLKSASFTLLGEKAEEREFAKPLMSVYISLRNGKAENSGIRI